MSKLELFAVVALGVFAGGFLLRQYQADQQEFRHRDSSAPWPAHAIAAFVGSLRTAAGVAALSYLAIWNPL